jgi:hypothetical protein
MRRTTVSRLWWLALPLLVLGPSTAAREAPAQVRGRIAPVNAVSYFPLQVGNHWLYARQGTGVVDTWRSAVSERFVSPVRRVYFALDGHFGPRRLLRSTSFNGVFEYNPRSLGDNLVYLLGAPVGTTWVLQLEPLPTASPLPDCLTGSGLTVGGRTETVTVPAGVFTGVVRIDWSGPCRDAGITAEWFAPGVGLIKRTEDSFVGPITSELVQAELGGQVLPQAPYATTLSIDRPEYVNNLMPPLGPDSIPAVRGAFTVRNSTGIPITFVFGGCKSLAIVVFDALGNEVLRARSDDGGCCLCDVLLPVRLVKDVLALPFAFKLQTSDGQPLKDGRYGVVVTLETLDEAKIRPSGTATIEVRSID